MIKKTEIAEGVTLNVIATDKFKSDYLSFDFVQLLEAEKASLNALIPQVLLRGTEKHPNIASIKTALDELYAASVEGKTFKRGDWQVCSISASWLADRFSIDGTKISEGTLDMVEELLLSPFTENGAFSASYVESEKKDLIDEINGLINNKNAYAVRRCREEMCRGEAGGLSEYGDVDSVKAVTPVALYGAYRDMLESARVEIFYVGSLDAEKMAERLKIMFSSVRRRAVCLKQSEVKRSADEVKNVTEKVSATQGKLSLGFRTGSIVTDKNYGAFPVFVEMYGNSPVSKLFMNVREKLSLCYYCRAVPDGLKGTMIVSSGIEVSQKDKAQSEILRQLDNMKKGDFTEDELILAKKSLKNAYNELNDSPPALEGWYLTRRLCGLDESHEEVCERLMKVTADEVKAAAGAVVLDTVYFLEGTLSGEEDEADE